MTAPLNDNNTLLVLYGMGQPLYSSRNLTQTFTMIAAAKKFARTVNGSMMDLSYEEFRLFATDITCTDVEAPSLDGIYVGMMIEVDCAFELSYPTGGQPSRWVVDGSERVEGDYTFYRPRLGCVVIDYDFSFAEYQADYTWKLSLEESGLPMES